MIDYCPFIARAVAALEPSTEESRSVLYQRLRNAQLANLRRTAFSEVAIKCERLSLEDAIRTIELRVIATQRSAPRQGDEVFNQSARVSEPRTTAQLRRSRPFAITESQRWAISATALILTMNAAGGAVLSALMYAMN
jgi:hypothetical protein